MVGRCVGTILVNVRPVGVNCQRHHGSTGGEREGKGHESDELSHGGLLCYQHRPRVDRGHHERSGKTVM